MDEHNLHAHGTDGERASENETNTECAQCAEYLAGWKRSLADYENLKKETEKQRVEFVKFANERLIETLLPAVDQYDTALEHTPDISGLPIEDQKRLKNWIIGLHAVYGTWETVFKAIGLEAIAPVTGDAFDPHVHEAVGDENSANGSEGSISRIVQKGWRLNGKLLRPAKVIIIKKEPTA